MLSTRIPTYMYDETIYLFPCSLCISQAPVQRLAEGPGPAHSSSFPNSAQMCRCATCSKYIQYVYDENIYLFPCMYSLCIGQARIQRLVWGPCLLLSKSWPCYLTPGAGVTPCSSSSFPILQGLSFPPHASSTYTPFPGRLSNPPHPVPEIWAGDICFDPSRNNAPTTTKLSPDLPCIPCNGNVTFWCTNNWELKIWGRRGPTTNQH